jgi:sugar O-acyltransferase (sialic acid O-acetyltransferase NeuD family)
MQIVIFGAGKVADVLGRHITAAGTHDVAAFTVDRQYAPEGSRFHGKPVVAFEEIERLYPPDKYGMLIAVGYHELNAVRQSKYEAAKAKGYRLASYVSARAGVGDWLQMGENCIILDNATIEPGVVLGNNVVVWSNVLVGHHTTIEDHSWIAGQAVFGGSARLGAGSFVGLGAIVGHEVELGDHSFIGAGAVVTKCAGPKSVFIAANTELFRLDSERFLKISKLR